VGRKHRKVISIDPYLNGSICPSLQLISGVHEGLNAGGVDMRTVQAVSIKIRVSQSEENIHSREIKDNGTEKGFVAIILDNNAFPGAGIVPWSLTGTEATEITPSASRCPGVVHHVRVD
jgi:hypothetical protein